MTLANMRLKVADARSLSAIRLGRDYDIHWDGASGFMLSGISTSPSRSSPV